MESTLTLTRQQRDAIFDLLGHAVYRRTGKEPEELLPVLDELSDELELARDLAGERDRYELRTPSDVVARAIGRSLDLNDRFLADDRVNGDLEMADVDLDARNVLTGVLERVAPVTSDRSANIQHRISTRSWPRPPLAWTPEGGGDHEHNRSGVQMQVPEGFAELLAKVPSVDPDAARALAEHLRAGAAAAKAGTEYDAKVTITHRRVGRVRRVRRVHFAQAPRRHVGARVRPGRRRRPVSRSSRATSSRGDPDLPPGHRPSPRSGAAA